MVRWGAMAVGVCFGALASRAAARADGGWSACFLDGGGLAAPAKAAGLTGVFIIDAAAPQSQIDATQATLAGLDAGPASIVIELGGVRLDAVAVQVLALDARTAAMATPVTGVLGADVLKGRVLEVRTDPCRFRLTGGAPSSGGPALASLPLTWLGGAPAVAASVTDGATAQSGLFRIATGSNVAVSLEPDAARLAGAPADARGLTAPLRGLSLGGLLAEDAPAEIADQPDAGVLGSIGEPVWTRYGFRLDLRASRLTLYAPTKKARRGDVGGP